MSLPAPTATGSTAVPVPHVATTIKQEPSSHSHKQEPTPRGSMRPAPRRVSDQGYAPHHHHKIVAAAAAAPQANQSGPHSSTRRVSDQGYAHPTIKREYPAQPTPTLQMPPPTPSQGLFQSSLFGGGTSSSSHEEPALARPSTSSGRKSMEAHVLVPPPPLVPPATLKRPPLVQVHDLDPNSNNNKSGSSSLKKPNNFNPYANHCKKMM
jgi:hypothetical protein